MGVPDIRKLDSPWPLFRGVRTITVGNDDIDLEPPGAVRAVTSGNLDIIDSLGVRSDFDSMLVGDDIVGPGSGLVAVSRILGSSTVTSVQIGTI